MRALIVTVGFLAIAGIASAIAPPPPTTLVHTPGPVKALTQDGGYLGWLARNSKMCNTVHLIGNQKTYVLPQPSSSSMTCHWNLSTGIAYLAVASDALAALWTLHEKGSDFVMSARVGGKEVEVDQLSHPDGTGWWLGGIAGGGSTLAYASVHVEYVDPLGCGSGGSCKKKISAGRIELVSAGQKTLLPGGGPALALAVTGNRIAYIPATTVATDGSPASSAGAVVRIKSLPSGAFVSQAKTVGVPLAIGLAPHVLAVLTRNGQALRLVWYDPATGHRINGIGVPLNTEQELAVNDQYVAYRFGRFLRALRLSTGHIRPLGETAAGYLGLSLDQGRLVWAENTHPSGVIRALTLH